MPMTGKFRTVPDTNVIIAAHKPSGKSPNKEYIDKWLGDKFVLLYSKDTLCEYIEKLFDKKVPKDLVERFAMHLATLGEEVYIKYFHLRKYPIDEDDIPFVLCAYNGDASHLITYDNHLLKIGKSVGFTICKPVEFLRELRSQSL